MVQLLRVDRNIFVCVGFPLEIVFDFNFYLFIFSKAEGQFGVINKRISLDLSSDSESDVDVSRQADDNISLSGTTKALMLSIYKYRYISFPSNHLIRLIYNYFLDKNRDREIRMPVRKGSKYNSKGITNELSPNLTKNHR